MKYLTILFLILTTLSSCQILPFTKTYNTGRLHNFDYVAEMYSEQYALFGEKGIDWAAHTAAVRNTVHEGMSDQEFFNALKELLAITKDKHISLMSEFDYYNAGGYQSKEAYFSREHTPSYIPAIKHTEDDYLSWGITDDNIGYIYVMGFTDANGASSVHHSAWAEKIDPILEELQNVNAIILDIRDNHGGLPQNVVYLANRFTTETRDFIRIQNKIGPNPGDFDEPEIWTITPQGDFTPTAPILLLTNIKTISGGEWFSMAMKTLPNVTQFGAGTAGAMSLSLYHEMPNGWGFRVSVQLITSPDGSFCPEESGINPAPEHIVENTAASLEAKTDPQLEAALTYLRGL